MLNPAKTKILFVITKSNWGGAQKYVFDLATSLNRDKYIIKVAFGGTGNYLAEVGQLKIRLDDAKIETIFLKNFMRDIRMKSELLAFFELYNLFRKEKPDIVHINSSKVGGLGAIAGRLAFIKKIIFTSHGLVYEENRPPLQKIFIKFLSWLTFLFATDTIMISVDTYKKSSRLPFIKNKLHLIYNGLPQITHLSKNIAREVLVKSIPHSHPATTKTWIGTIGELHKNKGLEYIITAFIDERLKDYILIIIGEGEERKNLEILISKNNLSDRIFLLGNIIDASIYLKAFDIFTLTSIKEGHPYVLLEAGQAGLPVIGTNIPGIRDMIEDEKSGILIQSKNPKEITEAIIYLTTKEKLRESCAKTLEEKITKNFQLEKMLAQTLKVYGV